MREEIISAHEEWWYVHCAMHDVFAYDPADDGPECEVITRILTTHPWETPVVIDLLVYQSALELGYNSGKKTREDMLKAGMTDAQVDEVIRKAFAWRYENDTE